VELRGLEPLTPCLQIAVIGRVKRPELGELPPVSYRDVPPLTEVNGTRSWPVRVALSHPTWPPYPDRLGSEISFVP
jgi:hypothetical protein